MRIPKEQVYKLLPDACNRCGKKTGSYTCSYFNTQWICQECVEKEKKHRLYAKAVEEENEAVRNGKYWYQGIGLPDDLK